VILLYLNYMSYCSISYSFSQFTFQSLKLPLTVSSKDGFHEMFSSLEQSQTSMLPSFPVCLTIFPYPIPLQASQSTWLLSQTNKSTILFLCSFAHLTPVLIFKSQISMLPSFPVCLTISPSSYSPPGIPKYIIVSQTNKSTICTLPIFLCLYYSCDNLQVWPFTSLKTSQSRPILQLNAISMCIVTVQDTFPALFFSLPIFILWFILCAY